MDAQDVNLSELEAAADALMVKITNFSVRIIILKDIRGWCALYRLLKF